MAFTHSMNFLAIVFSLGRECEALNVRCFIGTGTFKYKHQLEHFSVKKKYHCRYLTWGKDAMHSYLQKAKGSSCTSRNRLLFLNGNHRAVCAMKKVIKECFIFDNAL